MNNPNPDLDNMFFLGAELIGFMTMVVISIRWRSRLIKENRNLSVKEIYT